MIVKKIEPVRITNMAELVLLARNEGIKDHIQIAKWIIARSDYWKNKGFQEIQKAMKDV